MSNIFILRMKQKKAHRSEYYWKVYDIYSGFYPSDLTDRTSADNRKFSSCLG